eukprot:CAMPEP_0202856896 /NCGR_PEP_ID=MMETSP1391-20130828/15_1 /ASSEMBLY_ACC=CAM_ASM_000867 /TAXON_ID=1034604 /ORGANISM="Chlamydomonas leiostraca, Strain SAG 11-49" /LENGTH=85 /DNA_ID=CAMNT_0049535607 /DNA_START=125 /DNA_END=378 /DNA_ORIENTATION=+
MEGRRMASTPGKVGEDGIKYIDGMLSSHFTSANADATCCTALFSAAVSSSLLPVPGALAWLLPVELLLLLLLVPASLSWLLLRIS